MTTGAQQDRGDRDLMTVEEFAAWQRVPIRTVRRRLPTMPGVIKHSREWIRIHVPTYLDRMASK